MDKLKWYLLKFIAKKKRQLFVKKIYSHKILRPTQPECVHIDFVSFSSKNDFPEQFISIYSFVQHVGCPEKWTICSDGTHTQEEILVMKYYFPFVEFRFIDFKKDEIRLTDQLNEVKEMLIHYANSFPLGKKMLYYLSKDITKQTILLDSDILFYKKSKEFFASIVHDRQGYFMFDITPNFDSRYTSTDEHVNANSGFIIINENFTDFDKAVTFMVDVNREYQYFTEQTFFHILMKNNGFVNLDTNTFIINTGDQFTVKYVSNSDEIVLRHYTSPVRYKMWQNGLGWHLSK